MSEIIPRIPRLYTALAESLACLVFIWPMIKRHAPSYWQARLLVMTGGQLFLQSLVNGWPWSWWLPGMYLNVFWMFLTIRFTATLSFKQAIYLCAKAFIAAEFSTTLAWQFYYLIFWSPVNTQKLPGYFFLLICLVVMYLIFYLLEKRIGHANLFLPLKKKDIFISILTAIIIFTMSNVSFLISATYPFGDNTSLFVIRTLVNLSGICIIYMQAYQRYEAYLKAELGSINRIFQLQYEQYLAYKESSQYLNQKFHDLKHQINVIREESNADQRHRYLNQMTQNLNQFEATITTGNGSLDTILTRKNTQCLANQISFTCLVDGQLLNFMDVMDICSIFGNALDNAIESVMKLSDPAKRIINLRLFKRAHFLMIVLENTNSETLTFSQGLPQTTKSNTLNHGYGLKSMAYIVEKYQGNLTIDCDDDWFNLKILIPLN
ncbi:GHKL domain-containing protein [uncultured Vagococcus sp.]|uniref:GHKL domain-containing protein n=1 Tax=uncultured Vagococcus sp. TaxID=189676 RepID=UPI0028D892CD|nr:GHKL domain-containing protein [uncultured Vagococcus sp.]